MEKKTIGSFLSALRKAAGMTQKDLAELLHVSDKAISRWERDECAPDLALIPVIAEVFNVTCDELLRGGRCSPSDSEPAPAAAAKAEKQRQWILKKTLSQYKSRTLLAAATSMLGLIAAVAATEGFYQRTLGFWLGAAFVLLGVVFQIVFWNSAWLSLSDETLDSAAIGPWKYRVLRLTEFSLGFSLCLLGVIWGYAGNGLMAWSNVLYQALIVSLSYVRTLYWAVGILTGGILVLFSLLLCHFLNPWLLKRGVFSLEEAQAQALLRSRRRKNRAALVFLVLVTVTAAIQAAATLLWTPAKMMHGTVYDQEAEFVAAVEERWWQDEKPLTAAELQQLVLQSSDDTKIRPVSSYGSTTTITNSEGETVCSFSVQNHKICFLRYNPDSETIFPIEVITFDDARRALDLAQLRSEIFLGIYVLEGLAVVVWYILGKRRKKAL